MGDTAVAGGARMDAIYRTQRHFYDLTRKYYLLGRDRMIAGLAVPVRGSVLEVGCGTGRNLIAAAQAWPQARLHGFDISVEMLRTASGAIRRAGLRHRIALAEGDATAFDPQKLFGVRGFDRIMFSYTLSMIPGWHQALVAAADALGDRGQIHIVDFGQQEGMPSWWRMLLFAWLGRFEVTPRADLHDALAMLAADRGLTLRFTPLHRGYAWSAVLSRR